MHLHRNTRRNMRGAVQRMREDRVLLFGLHLDALTTARDTADLAQRTKLYEAANKLIMDFLPGVPYVHTQPSLAFNADVKGYVPSPVSLESFATVSLG